MPGPYIQDGHYMYGNAFIQPYPAYYNSSWMHRKPPMRTFPNREFIDDGSQYISDNSSSTAGEAIMRSTTANAIVNIETRLINSLEITLYRMKEEDDTNLVLEIGKMYSVVYMTEGGLKVAKGILRLIDTTIPDECQRYIGEFNESVITAWIGLDCSTVGKSDKRKIYIASIRGLEEVPEDDSDYQPPEIDTNEMTSAQKLEFLVNNMASFNDKLDNILAKVEDNDQIIDKLTELDPAEKLAYIINKLDDTSLFDDIKDTIDSGVKVIKDHVTTEAEAKLNSILDKLGSMPYDDKIDYIISKIDAGSSDAVVEALNTTDEKIDYIIEHLENGFSMTFLD